VDDQTDDGIKPEDDDLPLSIVHSRDTIVFDGQVAQDYRFLVYRFAGRTVDIIARTYLDNLSEVAILSGAEPMPLPTPVMAYLQRRFDVIKTLGGPDGYLVVWQKPPTGRQRLSASNVTTQV
jgi:hypothetical protein